MESFHIPSWDFDVEGDKACKALLKKSSSTLAIKRKLKSGDSPIIASNILKKAKSKVKKKTKRLEKRALFQSPTNFEHIKVVDQETLINSKNRKTKHFKERKPHNKNVQPTSKEQLGVGTKNNKIKNLQNAKNKFNQPKQFNKKAVITNKNTNIIYTENAEEPADQNRTFTESNKKLNKKQMARMEKLRACLQISVEPNPVTLGNKKVTLSLRDRMLERLKSARFRYLNEQMYTTDGNESQKYFQSDPEAYNAYHAGYQQQVARWPLNPVDVIIKSVRSMPKNSVMADFGCGEAKLAKSVSQKVHSFDLVATNDHVTACDMAHVPLETYAADVAIFCLSLMGTNLKDYFSEANRVLKIGGTLKIAEVESRLEDIDNFIKCVQLFGFSNVKKDLTHDLFYFLDFKKIANIKNKHKLPIINLQPCFYKKR